MEYKVIKSKRKSFSMEIHPDGILVRAPLRATREQIAQFVSQHEAWALKHLAKMKAQKQAASEHKLSDEELQELVKKACEYIPKRCAFYAEKIGVSYGRITIRCQKTKWGSCSSKGNLNFNCLLMLTPPEVIDAIVVHELCHRLEMNHSARFYQQVLRVYPKYYQYHDWLRANGRQLLMMVHDQ